MAIHHEFGGNRTGFQFWDGWSREGKKYPDRQKIEKVWRSFDNYEDEPLTVATIHMLARECCDDPDNLLTEYFEPVEDIHDVAGTYARDMDQRDAANSTVADADADEHCLIKYSLRGKSAQFEAEMREQRFVLGEIAIVGHWTMIFAPPNTGKTLIVISLLIQGIKDGDINPEHVFYINADDGHADLTHKLWFAGRYGFHMLAPGHADLHARDLLGLLESLGDNGHAPETIVVLDTVKKFANPMDKGQCLQFGNGVREFTSKGGTVIALAHTNKNRATDGKPIPGGTSDFLDDADCAYIMDTIDDKNDICTVGFENIKSRGKVAKLATYQYSSAEDIVYRDLLDSVAPVDDLKAAAHLDLRDLPLIQAITDCINEGVTAKVAIIRKTAQATGESQRQAQRVLDKHTGTDPKQHKWKFTIGVRGVNTFELLPPPDDVPDIEDLGI